MAVRYYDDVLAAKLKRWNPASDLRVLKPSEVKRLFALSAEDSGDKPLTLPCIALSRNNDIELAMNFKTPKSYAGLKLTQTEAETAILNAIPIRLQYQLDIYTKTAEEGDEYLRQYLFKLINNPVIKIAVPYNGFEVEQIANIRVLSTVSDTSEISERLFSGQFTRWTIQLEIQDAYLYDIPYRRNWVLYVSDSEVLSTDEYSTFEMGEELYKVNKKTDAQQFDINCVPEKWREGVYSKAEPHYMYIGYIEDAFGEMWYEEIFWT